MASIKTSRFHLRTRPADDAQLRRIAGSCRWAWSKALAVQRSNHEQEFVDTMPAPDEDSDAVERDFVDWLDANHPDWRAHAAAHAPLMKPSFGN